MRAHRSPRLGRAAALAGALTLAACDGNAASQVAYDAATFFGDADVLADAGPAEPSALDDDSVATDDGSSARSTLALDLGAPVVAVEADARGLVVLVGADSSRGARVVTVDSTLTHVHTLFEAVPAGQLTALAVHEDEVAFAQRRPERSLDGGWVDELVVVARRGGTARVLQTELSEPVWTLDRTAAHLAFSDLSGGLFVVDDATRAEALAARSADGHLLSDVALDDEGAFVPDGTDIVRTSLVEPFVDEVIALGPRDAWVARPIVHDGAWLYWHAVVRGSATPHRVLRARDDEAPALAEQLAAFVGRIADLVVVDEAAYVLVEDASEDVTSVVRVSPGAEPTWLEGVAHRHGRLAVLGDALFEVGGPLGTVVRLDVPR